MSNPVNIEIEEIEITFKTPIKEGNNIDRPYMKRIKEQIKLAAIDEYRLCNLTDLGFEGRDDEFYYFRAVFTNN